MAKRHYRITIIGMGVQIDPQQLASYIAEAEVGYHRRGRGRPGRGAEPSRIITVRLTAEELELVDELVKKLKVTNRSGSNSRCHYPRYHCMRFTQYAFKHGISPEDAIYAASWPLWIEPFDDEPEPQWRELRNDCSRWR